MTEEARKLEDHPQHHKYKALFRKHTWWRSSDHRVFVITFREETLAGDITSIDLLEQNKESPIRRPYGEILDLYKRGMMERTSVMPD